MNTRDVLPGTSLIDRLRTVSCLGTNNDCRMCRHHPIRFFRELVSVGCERGALMAAAGRLLHEASRRT
jgi:hypothetical protein